MPPYCEQMCRPMPGPTCGARAQGLQSGRALVSDASAAEGAGVERREELQLKAAPVVAAGPWGPVSCSLRKLQTVASPSGLRVGRRP